MDVEKLRDYLNQLLYVNNLSGNNLEKIVKFEEFENMGFELPPSAKRLPKWWKRFLNTDWGVEIDRENEAIRFLRGEKAKYTTTPRISDQKKRETEFDIDKERFGKRLCLTAGVITIIGLYFFTWSYQEGSFLYNTFDVYYSGMAGLINLPTLLNNLNIYTIFPLIVVILTLLSGFIMLMGVVKPVFSFIGAIIPLIICLISLLISLGIVPEFISGFWLVFGNTNRYTAPFVFNIGGVYVGAIVLFFGGLFSILGGINIIKSKRG